MAIGDDGEVAAQDRLPARDRLPAPARAGTSLAESFAGADPEADAERARNLRRMKAVALGFLIGATVIFLACRWAQSRGGPPWLGYVGAAAEAGMIETTLQRAWDIIADQPPVEVVLRFAPDVATRVREATWHPSQRVEVEPDGSLLWRATVAGTIEIRLWILQWGADVEVLEPPALRDDVTDTLARALRRYRD